MKRYIFGILAFLFVLALLPAKHLTVQAATKEYSFYSRIADNSTYYVGPSSAALAVRTDKSVQEAPDAPTLESMTDTTVTLTYISGYEYSKDGRTWQTSNIFSGLTSATEYAFCQRKAETGASFASPASETLIVITRTRTGTVTYKAEYGLYVPDSQFKVEGLALTLSFGEPVRANCFFYGWSTKPYGTVEYRPGDTYTQEADLTLYAVFKDLCVPCKGTGSISEVCPGCDGNGYFVIGRSNCCGASYFPVRIDGIPDGYRCSYCSRGYYQHSGTSIISCDPYKQKKCPTCNGKKDVKMPHCVTAKPLMECKTGRSVTLVQQEDMEYSKDGNTWQRSPVFTGLIPGTTYNFYQRYIENAYRSPAKTLCSALTVSTNATKPKPEVPVLFSCSSTEVILVPLDGGEYSLDGMTWQTSNIFTNLQSDTQYTVYQRYAADGELDYSPTSDGLNVRTTALPPYTPGDVTDDGKINSLDGLMLLRYLNGWTITINSPEAMDVNADGKVNSLDGLILMRYLNSWDVTLG